MSIDPSEIQPAAVESGQTTTATGERAASIGGNADRVVLITGDNNTVNVNASPNYKPGVPFPLVRLPDNFVPRPDALNTVKVKLLGEDDRPLVVSAIAGLGGIGKSVLAAALVLDEEVRQRFEDGILWVTLGQNPDLLSLLGDWIRELDKSREAFSANTIEAAARYLGTLLAERQMLLVVDDVWNEVHADWFRVGGVECRVLVTTREARLAGAEYYDLDLMNEDEAIELVRKKLKSKWQPEWETEAKAFAKVVGYLPLALDLVTNVVGGGLSWQELTAEFEVERKAVALDARRRASDLLNSSESLDGLLEEEREQEQRKHSLQACFNLSLKRLNREQFEQFAWLGVLPEDVNLDRRVAAVLWDLPTVWAKKVLIDLRNRSFLTSGVETIEGELTYRVHDLIHDLARISISRPSSSEPPLGGLGMSLAAAHQAFLERYRNKATDRRWHKLPSDGYIHRHLTWHLIQAGWQDEIHALMAMSDECGNNTWFEACDRIGQPAIFVEDLGRAWELAEQMYGNEPTRSIVLQCRYALITATLNSLVANLPIEMMAQFVKHGFWTVEQAWAYVEQMQDEGNIANAIQALAPYLTKPLFALSLHKVRKIQSEYKRAQVLSSLAAIDGAIFPEALAAARAIQDDSHRAQVLSSLAASDGAIFSEALAAARAIQYEYHRAEVLSSLAAIDGADFPKLLAAARAIQNDSHRAQVLSSLAAIDEAIFPEALAAVRAIQNEYDRAQVLSSLAAIDEAIFPEALAAARAIQDDSYRADILSGLAAIDGAIFPEALAAARLIQDDSHRADILSSLAAIDGAIFPEALAAIRAIQYEDKRTDILSSLVASNGADFSELLAVARAIQDEYYRAKALSNLTASDRADFSELLAAAKAIQCEYNRAGVLSSLAASDGADFSELLAAAKAIQDEDKRAEVLSSLAAKDGTIFSEALAAARAIQYEYYRAEVLSSLAAKDGTIFSEALAAARAIQYEYHRAEVLSSLAAKDGTIFSEALAAARAIQDRSHQANILSNLATIDGADFSQLLEAASAIHYEYNRAQVLSSLATIDGADFSQLLEAASAIQGDSHRARALSSLAAIDGADFSELLEAARAIQDDFCRANILSSLAEHAPQNFLITLWQEIEQIADKRTRSIAIINYITRIPLDRLSHPDWCKYLHILAYRKRSELMEDLAKLYPAILHLGGETTMRGVVDAMNEVCSQWR
jgi:hypothetical protein